MIDESDDAPTRGARELYEELGVQLEAQRRALGEVLDGSAKVFGDLVRSYYGKDVPRSIRTFGKCGNRGLTGT